MIRIAAIEDQLLTHLAQPSKQLQDLAYTLLGVLLYHVLRTYL